MRARKRRRSKSNNRRLQAQQLEDRRLLTAEGSPFTLPTQTIDTTGTLGSLSSEIRWGDGSSTTESISASAPNGQVRIEFRYDLDDSNGFFNDINRRRLLDDVGRSVSRHLNDQLSAIVPSGSNTWTPNVIDPETGSFRTIGNLLQTVPENTIIIYAGGRNFPAGQRGQGGPGGIPANNGVLGTQEWVDTVLGRGQAGALGNSRTDYAIWGGSIAFDTVGTDWYFGRDPQPEGSTDTDFVTVATHELVHVLGFGVAFSGVDTSWETNVSGGFFRGPQAQSAYNDAGFFGQPPVTPDDAHWGDAIGDGGLLTLMRREISDGERQIMSPLDLAALDDIGWDVLYSSEATVSGTHVYPDNQDYPVEVIVRGNTLGERSEMLTAAITNANPTLTTPPTQTVVVDQLLALPTQLWNITDPGFNNPSGTPATAESLQFSIDWKDGSPVETGDVTILQNGNANQPTTGSISVSHQYTTIGNFDPEVTITDDDGGSVAKTFRVQVVGPPTLTLSLDDASIAEDAGDAATVLTITRSGPVQSTNQTITLTSDDESEAVLPATAVILANESSVQVNVDAKDDTLLDGTQEVKLTAGGNGLVAGETMLDVTDVETLTIASSTNEVSENASGPMLFIRRSNTDIDNPLDLTITGGDPNELTLAGNATIGAGDDQVMVQPTLIDDSDPEASLLVTYTFSAPGYQSGTVSFTLLDDEPPLFQNPTERFDVNNVGGVSSSDALRIINELGIRSSPSLDPESEQPNGIFLDVNGDYMASALDALLVINEVGRRFLTGETEQEALPYVAFADTLNDDDDSVPLDFVFAATEIF